MQQFRFFKKVDEYRTYIYEEIFTHHEFRNNLFYRGLIEFIIEHRAPIFFSLTKDEEFSHFTQYFNAVLDRGDYYKNDFIRSMYFAHDFVHMLFNNPLRPRDMTFEKYCEVLNVNEWIASNETEVYTYFRIDGARHHGLDYTILYDLLKYAGHSQPEIKKLLEFRKHVIGGGGEAVLEQHPEATMVFNYLRKFKENNKAWCKLWYEGFPEIPAAYTDERMCLPVLEYDKIMRHYTPGIHVDNQQEAYEYNMLLNIKNLALLAGLPEEHIPKTFDDCEKTLEQLEGKIIMPKVAEEFHYTYIENKKVGTPEKKELNP